MDEQRMGMAISTMRSILDRSGLGGIEFPADGTEAQKNNQIAFLNRSIGDYWGAKAHCFGGSRNAYQLVYRTGGAS